MDATFKGLNFAVYKILPTSLVMLLESVVNHIGSFEAVVVVNSPIAFAFAL